MTISLHLHQTMEYLSSDEANSPTSATIHEQGGPEKPGKESVLIIVIGSQQGITSVVHTLFKLGFAQMHEWSKAQIDPNSGKLMKILTKFIQ